MTPRSTLPAALAALLVAGAAPALAQVKIGATLSTTGPQASLGIPERNTISLLPTEIGGAKVEYVVLDDASDTTRAVSNSCGAARCRRPPRSRGMKCTPA